MSALQGPVFDFHVRLAPRPGARERLLDVLDGCGIDRAAVAAGGTIELGRLSRQLIEGGHIETDAGNDEVLAVCEGSDGRLVPFYFANPHRDAVVYGSQAADFRGLEISPAVHGVALGDTRVVELVAVAEDAGHPVYVVCIQRPGCGVADLVALAERFPGVTFVLGHSGVGNIDFYGVELVTPRPNIVLETSGGYTTVVRAALDVLGPERVLFGSEFPLQHPSVELAKFAALDVTPDQWHQIAWTNAVRLLDDPSKERTDDADRAPAPAAR